MTTSVDPRLIAEINRIETPCQVLGDRDRKCGDPAAWIITFTVRRPPHCRYAAAVCIAHKAAFDAYRDGKGSFDMQAVEL